jgi:hypothetical protein
MAGTLTISTLSDGTNSTSSTNCIQGSAKAWVIFDGTSGTRRASYNVSSVTRSTTGQYVINFTNALTDANYTFNISGTTPGSAFMFGSGALSTPTTTSLSIGTQNPSTSYTDYTYTSVVIFD